MSFQALNSALSGLRVAQQQLNVISTNVSNATSPGYTRKILPQSAQVLNSTGETIGAQVDTMIRRVDLNLERTLWTQVSGVSESEVKASYLDTIEKFHGATDKELSVAAQIAELKDKFAALSDSPADGFLLQSTLAQAKQVAGTFNQFGTLITQLRNDAQDEMGTTVDRVNDLLINIANLNAQVKGTANLNRSSAGIEDQRDEAIKELASLMNVTMFSRGDGVLVIQSTTGVQLCDERPEEIYFNPGVMGPTSTYPESVAGMYVGGDPTKNLGTVDITKTGVGGKLGGLIDLRDNMLVQYQAQVDELAHKLALRLDAQGMRLFTDQTGAVPSDAPPNLSTTPPTAVAYVGFATIIQVNEDVINNINQLQQGTYPSDVTIPGASNEVIRRVIQYGFGTVNYQEAAGTTNLNVTAPATDLQSWLGLRSSNSVIGGIDLSDFSQIDDGVAGTSDLMADLQEYFPSYPANDQFQITFEEPRLALGPTTITIDMSAAAAAFPLGPGINNALDQMVAYVNDRIVTAAVPAGLAASASLNTNGQLVINSRGNITLDATFAGGMGTEAFRALGLAEGTYQTEDPYFDVQVGNGNSYRITIEPGDDASDLVGKLEYDSVAGTGVPGLYVDFNAGTGLLTLRPGIDDSNNGPDYGGDIRIVAGPGRTTSPINAALAALPTSVGIVSALFGSYSVSGGTVSESSPIDNIPYRSETFQGSGVYVAFRQNYVGPGASVSTDILTGQTIVDYGQKMVNAQAQDIILNKSKMSDDTAVRDLLQERLLNESGVNIDEELSMLIVVQTAYAAAARAVSAASEMFDELLNSFR